uniref:ARF-like 2-binding protein n=1 Tax=Parastrongyloides trichosuri TaxID=131310 RepID=A0A0N4ZNV9_PARTI
MEELNISYDIYAEDIHDYYDENGNTLFDSTLRMIEDGDSSFDTLLNYFFESERETVSSDTEMYFSMEIPYEDISLDRNANIDDSAFDTYVDLQEHLNNLNESNERLAILLEDMILRLNEIEEKFNENSYL